MNQSETECKHLNIGTFEHTTVRLDEFDRPEYYTHDVNRCLDCGCIEPEPVVQATPQFPNIATIQLDYYLRSTIIDKYGYIYTKSGKSVKCPRCGKSWGIRYWKNKLNSQLLKHAYEHEIEESEERDERPE